MQYHCRPCGKTFYPFDQTVGLTGRSYNLGFEQLACELAALMPYREVTRICQKYLNIKPSETILREIILKIGGQIEKEEVMRQPIPPPPIALVKAVPQAGVTVVSVDGGRCQILEQEWKEVKMGVIYRHFHEKPPFLRHYVGAVDMKSDDFGSLLRHHYNYSAHANQGLPVVFIADGAPYNWEIKQQQFPMAIGILDFFHGAEHAAAVVHTIFAEGTKEAREWIDKSRALLYDGLIAEWMAQIKLWTSPDLSTEQRAALVREYNYFDTNRHRMDYKRFRDLGYPIGSGVMEGAIKQIVCRRLKSSEKWWTCAGANAVLRVRTAIENHNLCQFIKKAA